MRATEIQADDENSGNFFNYIHEAAISVMVTGFGDSFWTAYCFVDAYFKDTMHKESGDHYRGTLLDPVSAGKYSNEPPIWESPRVLLENSRRAHGASQARMVQCNISNH